MRQLILSLAALMALSGCVSSLESAYDEHARTECERETSTSQRGACLDRVDQNRRDR